MYKHLQYRNTSTIGEMVMGLFSKTSYNTVANLIGAMTNNRPHEAFKITRAIGDSPDFTDVNADELANGYLNMVKAGEDHREDATDVARYLRAHAAYQLSWRGLQITNDLIGHDPGGDEDVREEMVAIFGLMASYVDKPTTIRLTRLYYFDIALAVLKGNPNIRFTTEECTAIEKLTSGDRKARAELLRFIRAERLLSP